MGTRNQPTYDFLSGNTENSPPHQQPFRETFRQSHASKADHNNEALRSQLHTLQYELDALKQDRELTKLQHEQDLRDALNRSEADFKRAQSAEAARDAATKRADALARDWKDVEGRAANEKVASEKKLRSLQEESRGMREELEDAQAELSSRDRQGKYEFSELQRKYGVLQESVEGVQQDLQSKVSALQSEQQKLGQREAQIGELEDEVLRLKAQTGDSDTLAVIKKELSEQVAYIKKLEGANREQFAEVKQLRKAQKNVEVVEEEKRSLEARLRLMDDLRRELSEVQLQKRILEDEKRSWTSYLDSEAAAVQYDTPEELAKAFLQERLDKADLLDKLGSLQPELSTKDAEIERLTEERSKLQSDLETFRSAASVAAPGATGGSNAKARARLERQKYLVTKEVEYLRAQMKTFEAEEAEFNPEQKDEEQMKRVNDLEAMVEEYRTEVEKLQVNLSRVEAQPAMASPKKRSRENDEQADERLGELKRKMRTLQADLDKLQSRNQLLEAELKAGLSQITSLKESSRTRVLELRNNPTAEVEAIKMTTLSTLREENQALLTQLQGKQPNTKVVPVSTLENVRLQLEEAKTQIAQNEKKALRLRQIYASKATEFREAVAAMLGWRLDFMPNGRVKATSILYPSLINEGEEEENSIVFDGENGTMKVSGGPQSVFASEIKGLIEFWVEGRREIPCFLAACTLEFYDRTTRAAK